MSGPPGPRRFRSLRGIPPIKALMTPFPYSIGSQASLAEAQEVMKGHDIRHLPVKEGERLVGVVSDRQIELAVSGGDDRPVGRIAGEAYVVDLSTPADRVARAMAERHLEAALVVKEGRLAGIFTTTDAGVALADLLRALFPGGGGDEVA